MSLLEKTGAASSLPKASYCMVEGVWEDGESRCTFYCFAGKRLKHPQVCMFTKACYLECDGRPYLSLEPGALASSGNLLSHWTGHMALRQHFAVQHPGGKLKTLSLCVLVVAFSDDPAEPLCRAAWPDKRIEAKHTFWPRPVVEKLGRARVSPGGADLDAAMRGAFQQLPGADGNVPKSCRQGATRNPPRKKCVVCVGEEESGSDTDDLNADALEVPEKRRPKSKPNPKALPKAKQGKRKIRTDFAGRKRRRRAGLQQHTSHVICHMSSNGSVDFWFLLYVACWSMLCPARARALVVVTARLRARCFC